jgi:hypothetical protein
MNWYGKEHLNPKYTNQLMKKWDAPPGNTAHRYYGLFPELYPKHLPDDHHIVAYDEFKYPTHRDYSQFRSAPRPKKSSHIYEWEDGYGPCNGCEECLSVKKHNEERSAKYYRALEIWRETGAWPK